MYWKWFGIGAGVAALFGTIAALSQWHVLILWLFLGFGSMINFMIAIATNAGRGQWSQAGYSHVTREPFPIPPVLRPRLGGFATGYAVAGTTVFYVAIGIIW